MLRPPDPVAWVIVLVVIAAVDFVWFTFLSKRFYDLDALRNTLKSSNDIGKALFAVISCAALASLVLCSLKSNDYGEAALTGAAVGGLVFYVFNVCAWYILDNSWPFPRAAIDFLYGTALYTLVSMLGHSLSGES